MDISFLSPLRPELLEDILPDNEQAMGRVMELHTSERGFPELDDVQIAIIGVKENRRAEKTEFSLHFDAFRKYFYRLYPGNWHLRIADLGDIAPGAEVEDTYFAVQRLIADLVRKEVIPVILGGGQDLIYAQYRAYDALDQMVNLVNVDHRFDLGDAENPISNRSYIGKIIVDQPYNLFNYSNLGYQTYFNAQEEIELMDRLFFDAFRLGEVTADLSLIEPVMRDASLVGIDLGSVGSEALGAGSSPNGFDGKQICSLARYAGISDKVSSFGVFEYAPEMGARASMLLAQIVWYFMEGVNFRTKENTIAAKKEFIKYQVPLDDQVLVFYKSPVSGRWWIEIPFFKGAHTKLKRQTLLPCSEEDYLEACNQVIPERWYKAKRKNEI